ncbi:hypothetical protein E4U60_001034 [Claviceps pazoutovae]|uniref:Acyl-protein thioesterase 1 n=1 Tax=Claviceps pazoutovae TaxID=1649127 RepID=A0A9P7MCW9_9HYPO|nr:hypothetical protein E4U60_001034 [Claviceps pazoutovae]
MLRHRRIISLSAILLFIALTLPLLRKVFLFLAWGPGHQISLPTNLRTEGPSLASSVDSSFTKSSSVVDIAAMSAASSSSSIRRVAPLVFPAVGRHTATVIFVHGLGDTGHGWADAVQLWRKKPRLNEIKFILPHAPQIPITMNFGMSMPGWFDIKTLQKGEDEDVAGVMQTRQYLHDLIQQEISAGIPSERIVLGGFSQGGAMSILSGLTAPFKMGGIVGLSSWLLLHQTFKQHVPEGNANQATPVFMGHGDKDPLVLYDLAKDSEKALKDMGYSVTFKTYRGMQHSAYMEELVDVQAFIEDKLPPKGDAN